MKVDLRLSFAAILCVLGAASRGICEESSTAPLPGGVKAVWDLGKAHRETTPTRERICINGLWQWQPAGNPHPNPLPKGEGTQVSPLPKGEGTIATVPTDNWGYFKVPGCWPGIGDYMQKDCQTLYPHPSWKGQRLGSLSAAWYEREIEVPSQWAGRRIAVTIEYLNSFAAVYVDGKKAGEVPFPAGEVDLTALCPAGSKHVLSILVVARPLQEIMLMFNDTNAAKRGRSQVARRGLCGDVYLAGSPRGARIDDVKVDTSVRKGEITLSTALANVAPNARYAIRAVITDHGRKVKQLTGKAFQAAELKDGRIAVTEKWEPEKLWDIHTPQNTYEVAVSLVEEGGFTQRRKDAKKIERDKVLDVALPVRFGFREFWIDGRDFYLNGTRIFLSALPLDNAQTNAAAAGYEGAKETMLRLKQIGINFVYTHNYGCEPGTHLSFEEILRAADDVGMLVSLSQPHFAQYDWQMPGALEKNGYAHHARFYVRVAGSHPSVVFYSMSHNATGYADDMNPDMIDGAQSSRDNWASNNVKRALLAEAVVARLDPGRIVYHHSSGNLSSMHTSNFYTNMAPAQELDDWFGHWATKGVKPVFTCEYMVPCTWDWTMYRGWYKGKRNFGSAVVPWEFCVAEWSSQFLGDRAYRISEAEKRNLRWEAEQFRQGRLWHRWDYPYQVGSPVFESQHEIIGMYLASNWRAFRTWGVSAISPWEYHFFWSLRQGVDKGRKQLKVDWENLQRPGFSPDYIDGQFERMDMAFERSDWIPTADGQAILRNNMPLLAYIGGKPAAFTSKDHNFYPGETVEKQLIIINNSRTTVGYDVWWHLTTRDSSQMVGMGGTFGLGNEAIEAGQQVRIPLKLDLPAEWKPGAYDLTLDAKFTTGETQKDAFTINVMPRPISNAAETPVSTATRHPPRATSKIAVFDPKGETGKLLDGMGLKWKSVDAGADLAGYDILVVGKGALTTEGPGPDVSRVRDGLKVIVFEQESEVLEKRFGFRIAEYGLRQVFKRVPDHPILAGIETDNLRDWRGEATILPPRLSYQLSPRFNLTPTVKWCDIEVPRVWRCGNRGNVASVLIEKPARGDFLPILDGGYSLQYSPLMEYREGRGLVLFCQVDVTGRTEQDPAAETLAFNLLRYVSRRTSAPRRQAIYAGDPAGKSHLEKAGFSVGTCEGGKLSADQVLVVGPGGGQKLAASAPAIADWLKAGGHLLAIGLDEQNAAALLPFKVRMKKAEHIAAFFDPPGANSLLAGIGPADVHNRDPRELSLVSSGATPVGDGVLAKADGANVVFCQLAPWQFDSGKQYNLKRTFRRASFLATRLLANMGAAGSTPVLARFHNPVDAAKPEKRWLEGLYLDQPEEWDDPYRFFRW